MGELPRFVAIKSVDKNAYMRPELVDGTWRFQFTTNEVLTPFTRFELERATYRPNPETQLFHIRSCYNNKYWCLYGKEAICCGANQPEEDPSGSSSTLFQLVVNQREEDVDDDAPKFVYFYHYCNGARNWKLAFAFDLPETIAKGNDFRPYGPYLEFLEIIDLDKVMIMPEFVAFKDDNKNFLRIQADDENHDYLQFSDADITDQSVWNEIFTNSDGSIRIRSKQTGNFWGIYNLEDGWVCSIKDKKSNAIDSDPNRSWFTPIKVEKHITALRHRGNKNICRPLTDELVGENLLCANLSSITNEARLQVVELVTSRKIYNLRFDVVRARVSELSTPMLPTEKIKNIGKDPVTRKVIFPEEIITVSAWNTINSGDFGVPVSIDVPFTTSISVGKIVVKPESVTGYHWGEFIEKKKTRKIEDTITVQPMNKVSLHFSAIKVCVEIPFSYTRHDTLISGQTKIYDNIEDGVYTYIDTTEETTMVDQA